MRESAPRVLGTGLVALDIVVSSDSDSPVQAWAGGTCGNVLSILAWLGWDAYPIARMNDDAASSRVRADLQRWGVHLDLASCAPATSTPIIVQEIRQPRNGGSTHKFSWSCLRCGGWLPSFKPVTRAVVEHAAPYIPGTSVFFFDRVSRAALDMAAQAVSSGAVVMFEPSGRGEVKLYEEALSLAHIVKYADQRMAPETQEGSSKNLLLEIQTLGGAGLRYRLPQHKRNPRWRAMKAVGIKTVVDSCGSGDWTSAGLLSKLAAGGLGPLQGASAATVSSALKYGQELAARNCAFEGARGAMYMANPSPSEELYSPDDPGPETAVRTQDDRFSAALVGCPKCEAA